MDCSEIPSTIDVSCKIVTLHSQDDHTEQISPINAHDASSDSFQSSAFTLASNDNVEDKVAFSEVMLSETIAIPPIQTNNSHSVQLQATNNDFLIYEVNISDSGLDEQQLESGQIVDIPAENVDINDGTQQDESQSRLVTVEDSVSVENVAIETEVSTSLPDVGYQPGYQSTTSDPASIKTVTLDTIHNSSLLKNPMRFSYEKVANDQLKTNEDVYLTEGLINHVQNDTTVQELTASQSTKVQSQRDLTKRERDRLYRQKCRADPVFKEKEKQKTRERMQRLRNNTDYREKERKADRHRRRQSRQENAELREKERMRDREYRRRLRDESGSTQSSINGIRYIYNMGMIGDNDGPSVKVERTSVQLVHNPEQSTSDIDYCNMSQSYS